MALIAVTCDLSFLNLSYRTLSRTHRPSAPFQCGERIRSTHDDSSPSPCLRPAPPRAPPPFGASDGRHGRKVGLYAFGAQASSGDDAWVPKASCGTTRARWEAEELSSRWSGWTCFARPWLGAARGTGRVHAPGQRVRQPLHRHVRPGRCRRRNDDHGGYAVGSDGFSILTVIHSTRPSAPGRRLEAMSDAVGFTMRRGRAGVRSPSTRRPRAASPGPPAGPRTIVCLGSGER